MPAVAPTQPGRGSSAPPRAPASFWTEEEFAGALVAVTLPDRRRVRVVSGAHLEATIGARFFGRFVGADADTELAWEGPSGPGEGASSYVFSGAEGGAYTFRIVSERILGGSSRFDPGVTFVLGAAVTLP